MPGKTFANERLKRTARWLLNRNARLND